MRHRFRPSCKKNSPGSQLVLAGDKKTTKSKVSGERVERCHGFEQDWGGASSLCASKTKGRRLGRPRYRNKKKPSRVPKKRGTQKSCHRPIQPAETGARYWPFLRPLYAKHNDGRCNRGGDYCRQAKVESRPRFGPLTDRPLHYNQHLSLIHI